MTPDSSRLLRRRKDDFAVTLSLSLRGTKWRSSLVRLLRQTKKRGSQWLLRGETASQAKLRARSNFPLLSLRGPKARSNPAGISLPLRAKRSNPVLLGKGFLRLLRRQNNDLAVTLFVGHCEGRRPEAISYSQVGKETASQTILRACSDRGNKRCYELIVTKRQNRDLAVT